MDLFVFFLLFFTVSLLGYYSAWLDESGTGVVTNLCMWVVEAANCALFSLLFPSGPKIQPPLWF